MDPCSVVEGSASVVGCSVFVVVVVVVFGRSEIGPEYTQVVSLTY